MKRVFGGIAVAVMLGACATSSDRVDAIATQSVGFITSVVDACVTPMEAGKTIAEHHGEAGEFRRNENPEARVAAGLKDGDSVWNPVEAGPGVTIIESAGGCTVGVMAVPASETVGMLAALLRSGFDFSTPEFSSSQEARAVTTRQSKDVAGRKLNVVIVAMHVSTDFANLMATVGWQE